MHAFIALTSCLRLHSMSAPFQERGRACSWLWTSCPRPHGLETAPDRRMRPPREKRRPGEGGAGASCEGGRGEAQEGAGETGAGKGANIERSASKRRGGAGTGCRAGCGAWGETGGGRGKKRAWERRAQTHSECCWLSSRLTRGLEMAGRSCPHVASSSSFVATPPTTASGGDIQ